MKLCTKLLALLLCLALFCTGCGPETPADSTPPAQQPTAPAQTDAKSLYDTARAAVDSAPDLSLTLALSESRVVGGESYTEAVSGTAVYLSRGTDAMVAQIREALTFGTYASDYEQYYIGGTAYCQVNDYSFHTPMSGDEFAALQLPAVLLDSALYGNLSMEQTDTQTVITFSEPTALESWATESELAQLISAGGTATVNADGTLAATAYQAQYTLGTTVYTLSVTVGVSVSDDLKLDAMTYAQESTEIAFFEAPRILLQVVGDVYTVQSLSTSLNEVISCQAAAMLRQQNVTVDTWGSGDEFIAKADYTVNTTDYTGTATTYTQTELFRDGTYTSSVNGGSEIAQPGITSQQMRAYCEDTALATLMTMTYLGGAEMEDLGDFYSITFTGNETFAETMFGQVYSLISVDLDIYAPDYATDIAQGYLTINKYTKLPTAAGLHLSRTHTIDTVPYQTTYQLDQGLTFSSDASYEAITGQPEPETKPEETASPLFYKVTGENGQTLWLLGTIHIGDARTAYLPQELYAAFDASDALAVEFDISAFEQQVANDPALQQQLYSAYYYDDGSTIDSHLDPELYADASKLLLASGSNSINTPYMKVSTWTNLLDDFLLTQYDSLSSRKGVDLRLIQRARKQNKPILDIESGLSQAQMLGNFSDALQSFMLEETVDTSLIDLGADSQELYELWCQGDEAVLTEALQDDLTEFTEEELALYEEYRKIMDIDRNGHMLQAAKTYLESGETVFYAVGLAHVLGETGLVNALREAGYTVEIVTYS